MGRARERFQVVQMRAQIRVQSRKVGGGWRGTGRGAGAGCHGGRKQVRQSQPEDLDLGGWTEARPCWLEA